MNPKKQIKKLINKFNSKGKVLVTGGMGYIGSHTVVELIEAGYEVFIVDNLCNSNLDVLNGIETITGVRPIFENIDCTDYVMLDKFFRKYDDIKTVIHFAALKAVGESTQKPLPYYRNNLMSLVNLLELMAVYNVKNLVFSSSCTVYGQPEILPVTEDAPRQKALSPYGNTKQICEDVIVDTVHANKDIKSIMLRYFNPIGAHPSALIGELPNGVPNNLLPYVAQTAAGIRKKLQVFGDDYNTPDGSCIRDYINVVDLAKAHVSALKRLGENKVESIETFNIGTGKGLSVLELIDTFESCNEVKVPHEIVGRREGDIEQVWADPKLANDVLKWKAKSTIEETVKSIWKWQLHLIDDGSDAQKKSHYGSLLKGSS
ncbi:MAG: UDP-glucose 4-epimerase GalE [bacterium]